jgi:hypothetical protein
MRILSIPTIDFSNLPNWYEDHLLFFQFLNIRHIYSVYNKSIICYQEDKIFNKSSFPKGITVIFSEKDIESKDQNDKIKEIIQYSKTLHDKCSYYFLSLFWSNYQIYKILEDWREEINHITTNIDQDLSNKELEDQVNDTVILQSNFAIYSNYEKVNMRRAIQITKINRIESKLSNSDRAFFEFNIFKDMEEGIEIQVKDEEERMMDIQNQLNILTSYYRDKSNIKLNFSNNNLQKQIKIFTITISVVGIIVTAIPIIGKVLGWWPDS